MHALMHDVPRRSVGFRNEKRKEREKRDGGKKKVSAYN
jgi:hypothetical protein